MKLKFAGVSGVGSVAAIHRALGDQEDKGEDRAGQINNELNEVCPYYCFHAAEVGVEYGNCTQGDDRNANVPAGELLQ